MLKKLLVTAIAAAALSVPLAGAAFADVGNNQGGTGGTPGAIGEYLGVPPHTLGSEVKQVAKLPGNVPSNDINGVGPGQRLQQTGIPGSH